jgi:NADH:ubiquinone reductase (H+-translocating)
VGPVARVDNHSLINLSLPRKLLASLGLLVGVGLFFAALLVGVLVTEYDPSVGAMLRWGASLGAVRVQHPLLFWALLIAHAASLALVLAVAGPLFARVAIARGARKVLLGSVVVLGALDLFSWLLLPLWPSAQRLLGLCAGLDGLLLLYLILRPLHDMWIYRRWRGNGGKPVHVVVVGGGFAGLDVATHLDRVLGYHRDLRITVIDRRNYFLFPPLLPSVAAGAIETRQVTYPFRRIFEATNIAFKKEFVDRIDLDRKVIHARVDIDDDPQTGDPTVICCDTAYDYLVLCPGSDTHTFGTPGAREHAFFMRELGDAIAVRNQVIDCFERAARDDDPQRRREMLRFVIVGGGPTGVELASEIRDLIDHFLMRRYPELAADEIEVILVQSADQILPGWHASVVAAATKQLQTMGVKLLLSRKVVAVTPFAVRLDGDQKFDTRTCVWCAGVRAAPLLSACSGLPLHKTGRVAVDPDLRVPGRPDVFVLGDASLCMHEGKPLPPLGQVAFQQGKHTAANLVRLIRGEPTRPFQYFNFGALVSVGDRFAALELLGVRLSGRLAWFIWRTLYLVKLVGFGNRIRVVLDWTLDLIIERSISQIAAERQDYSSDRAAAPPAPTPAPTAPPPAPAVPTAPPT